MQGNPQEEVRSGSAASAQDVGLEMSGSCHGLVFCWPCLDHDLGTREPEMLVLLQVIIAQECETILTSAVPKILPGPKNPFLEDNSRNATAAGRLASAKQLGRAACACSAQVQRRKLLSTILQTGLPEEFLHEIRLKINLFAHLLKYVPVACWIRKNLWHCCWELSIQKLHLQARACDDWWNSLPRLLQDFPLCSKDWALPHMDHSFDLQTTATRTYAWQNSQSAAISAAPCIQLRVACLSSTIRTAFTDLVCSQELSRQDPPLKQCVVRILRGKCGRDPKSSVAPS